MPDHLIGLLLGAEEDWPQAFETILGMVGPITDDGAEHTVSSERLTIEPFQLDDPVRTPLVIDRLAHWYYHPREWLKKAALVNGTYLLNSPFTFQSMEKHSAYCAMVRLGLKVPPTTLVPYKNPVDNVRWAYTAERYNQSFDLDRIAEELGYPLYMKPFDGGGWRGVSRINDRDDLHRAYDESGEMLMHLQATVDYEHFARALSIGPETMVMDFRPDQPMHNRYAVSHGFLSEAAGLADGGDQPDRQRVLPLGVQLGRDAGRRRRGLPDRLRQRLPGRGADLAALLLPVGDQGAGALVDVLRGDRPQGQRRPGDRSLLRDRRRPGAVLRGEDAGLPGARRRVLRERAGTGSGAPSTCRTSTSRCWEWVSSDDFDRLLRQTVQATYPPHEQDQFVAHFRGLIDLWIADNASERAS